MVKRWLKKGLIKVYEYLMGRDKEDKARLFSVVPCEKRGVLGTKPMKLHLNTRKHSFIVRVVNHWNRLFRESVESSFLKKIQNLTRLGPGQRALADPASVKGLD